VAHILVAPEGLDHELRLDLDGPCLFHIVLPVKVSMVQQQKTLVLFSGSKKSKRYTRYGALGNFKNFKSSYGAIT
jgi:hypothetical protein